MDAIKKKMQSLKTETDNALQRAEELDKEAKEATQRAEKYEESVSFVLKMACLFLMRRHSATAVSEQGS